MINHEPQKIVIEVPVTPELEERLRRVESLLETIVSAIVVRQKDAAEVADVTEGTIIRKAASGKVKRLSKDGEKKQYITLEVVEGLKKR